MTEGQILPGIPAGAPKISISVPIFAQVVVVGLPRGWKMAHENAAANHYLVEHIPAEQTLDRWTDMITVQSFKDLATRPGMTADTMIVQLMTLAKGVCGDRAFGQRLPVASVDSFQATAAIIGCSEFSADQAFGAKKGQSELAYYIAIKGAHDMYVIHRARRGVAFDLKAPLISPAEIGQWHEHLQPIKLCDPVPGTVQIDCWERKPR